MLISQLFEDQHLNEERAEINGQTLSLLRNPSATNLQLFIGNTRRGAARGTLIGTNLYIWDAYLATHEQVQAYFNINHGPSYAFVERHENEFAFSCGEDELSQAIQNPQVERALNNPDIVIATPMGETTLVDLKNNLTQH